MNLFENCFDLLTKFDVHEVFCIFKIFISPIFDLIFIKTTFSGNRNGIYFSLYSSNLTVTNKGLHICIILNPTV